MSETLSAAKVEGAAAFLCYLRDLFRETKKESFTTAEILKLLDRCAGDREMFPDGVEG